MPDGFYHQSKILTISISILILKAASLHKSFQVDDLQDLEVAHVVARSRSSRVGHIVEVFSKEDTEMKIAGGLQLWKWVICNCNEDVDCN